MRIVMQPNCLQRTVVAIGQLVSQISKHKTLVVSGLACNASGHVPVSRFVEACPFFGSRCRPVQVVC